MFHTDNIEAIDILQKKSCLTNYKTGIDGVIFQNCIITRKCIVKNTAIISAV